MRKNTNKEIKFIIDKVEIKFNKKKLECYKNQLIQINEIKDELDLRNAWYDMTLEAFELLVKIVLKQQFTDEEADKIGYLLQCNIIPVIWGLCADVDNILRNEYQLVKYY